MKLKYLDNWNQRRRLIAKNYTEALKDSEFTVPFFPDWAEPVWHLYVIQSNDRDNVQNFLKQEGIGTLIHYPIPPHKQKAYASLAIKDSLVPLACSPSERCLSLPIGPHLNEENVNKSDKYDPIIFLSKGFVIHVSIPTTSNYPYKSYDVRVQQHFMK